MDACPTLPETGGSLLVLFVIAAIAIGSGLALVVLARGRRLPLFIAIVVVGSLLALTGAAHAQETCPAPTPTSTTSTTGPPPTTTTPVAAAAATEATSPGPTTTSTTAPPVAPLAVPQTVTMGINTTITIDLLDDGDTLGTPPATLTWQLNQDASNPVVTVTGAPGASILQVTSGNTLGSASIHYVLSNAAGTSGANELINVTADSV